MKILKIIIIYSVGLYNLKNHICQIVNMAYTYPKVVR